MRRQITRTEMEDLVATNKGKSAGHLFAYHFIAGFPGETLDDVEELKAFLERQRLIGWAFLPIRMKKIHRLMF